MKSTEQWIQAAQKLHGTRYRYNKVDYKGNNVKVCIECTEHGEFWQTPGNHLSGKECLKCSYEKRGKKLTGTNDLYVEKARKAHGSKYDYSKVVYVNAKTKICIICAEHGEFLQLPSKHLAGNTCPVCADKIRNLNNLKKDSEFIEEAQIKHNHKYSYDKVEYLNARTKLIITCEKHGDFHCTPNNHLRGKGCPKCVGKNKSTDDWIEDAKQVHGDKYDYSKVHYKKCDSKVCIQCGVHGDFWQVAQYHLSGNGCPACKQSKLENEVDAILGKLSLKYERQYKPLFLKNGKGQQSLDFFLHDYNIGIECQGEQHFKPIDFAGKGEKWMNQLFDRNKNSDERKLKRCFSNGIKIIYVIDKDEFRDMSYHFNVAPPFSGNVSYTIIHVRDFEQHLIRLQDIAQFFGFEMM